MVNIYEENVYKVITGSGSGSAFAIKNFNYLITNYHVVTPFREVGIEDDKKMRYLAKVIYVNSDVDIAFLEVEGLELKSNIELDCNLSMQNLDEVFIIGYPFGMPKSVTKGVVSAHNQYMDGRYYLQTDAAVNPGNSGGVMLTKEGKVAAVVTAKFTNADNMGFGILLKDLCKEINEFKKKCKGTAIKCNSCSNFICQKSDFCPKCGNKIDTSIYLEPKKSEFEKFIEPILERANLNPTLCALDKNYWSFYKKNVLIRIFLSPDDEGLYVTSPLNLLPNKPNLKLFEYILSNKENPFFLGVYKNEIYLSYRIHQSEIFSSYKKVIANNLLRFINRVDELQEYLLKKFDAPYSKESKTSV